MTDQPTTDQRDGSPPGEPQRVTDVIAYLRVSTGGQVDGYGLGAQRDAIEAWCAAVGRRLVDVFADEGVSGTVPFQQRPALGAALVRLVADGLDGLVVHHLDRLARHLHEQEACLAHVWRSGHRVYAADVGEIVPDDPADPMRTAMRQMMGCFAQLERGMIVARMAAGRAGARSAGMWYTGKPPYGWRSAGNGRLVAEPVELQLVDWMVRQRDQGYTWNQIVDRLNSAGTTPGPNGGRWHVSAVRRIVARGLTPPPGVEARG